MYVCMYVWMVPVLSVHRRSAVVRRGVVASGVSGVDVKEFVPWVVLIVGPGVGAILILSGASSTTDKSSSSSLPSSRSAHWASSPAEVAAPLSSAFKSARPVEAVMLLLLLLLLLPLLPPPPHSPPLLVSSLLVLP